jgi:hypothetical protein
MTTNRKIQLIDVMDIPREKLKDELIKFGLWNDFREDGNPSYSMDAAWILEKRHGIAIIPQEHKGGSHWLACAVNYVENDGNILIHVKHESAIVCDNAPEAIVRAVLVSHWANITSP